MSLMSFLNPQLVLRRSFPDQVAGYYKTSMSGPLKNFSVGYNFVVADRIVSAVTLFGYRRESSLISGFDFFKDFGSPGGKNHKYLGEKKLNLKTLDGTYTALMSAWSETVQFDNTIQHIISCLHMFEIGNKIIKIRSSCPFDDLDFANEKMYELIANLKLNI